MCQVFLASFIFFSLILDTFFRHSLGNSHSGNKETFILQTSFVASLSSNMTCSDTVLLGYLTSHCVQQIFAVNSLLGDTFHLLGSYIFPTWTSGKWTCWSLVCLTKCSRHGVSEHVYPFSNPAQRKLWPLPYYKTLIGIKLHWENAYDSYRSLENSNMCYWISV